MPSPSAEKDRARTAARRRASPRRAAGQLTDATRDGHDRVTRVDYGNGEVETFAYDKWGRLAAHTRGKLKETYAYDHFGRLVGKEEDGTVFAYAYDAWGRRTQRTIRLPDDGEATEERRVYDRHGRLAEVAAFGTTVKWRYDAQGRVARQVVDGTPIDFAYTRDGRLAGKWLGGRERPDASVEYEYARDGRIAARTANGVRQTFEHDARGRLVAVREGGRDVERYAYDRAGNMVRKTVRGRTTEFAFDGANQLVSSTTDGVTTRYAYDAAGRLVKEGGKAYRYGWLDKVLSVAEGGKTYTYAYHADGQLARADYGGGRSEDFAWDGLALVRRGDEQFVNEPHVGGGNPVVSSKGAAYFNDILGTTVGVREGRGSSRLKSKRRYTAAALTAFGEPVPVAATSHNSNIRQFDHSIISSPFFTGKPEVEGLGYAFLYRNYRADLAKWQTADPLGYPDGWNQLAYCGNDASGSVDVFGGIRKKESEKTLFDRPIDGTWHHYEWLPDGSEVLFQWWEKMVEITWGVYDVVYPGKEAQIKLEQGLEFTATVGGLAIAVIGLATGGMAYSIAGVAVGLAGLYAYLQDHENDSELRLRDTYPENKYSTYRIYKTIPE